MHKPPLILVIDDATDFLEIISVRLHAAGFEVKTAVDVVAGVEIARHDLPDLVLLDINMPLVNGTEALLDFKKDAALAGLKVAFLTSMTSPWPGVKDKEKFAKEIGAAAFWDKTKDFENIVEEISELLKIK